MSYKTNQEISLLLLLEVDEDPPTPPHIQGNAMSPQVMKTTNFLTGRNMFITKKIKYFIEQ